MKRLLSLFLGLAIFCPLTAAHSGPLEAADARSQVLGPASTYMPLVAGGTGDKWVLLKVTPDQNPLNGFATPGGSTVSGHYTVIGELGVEGAAQSGNYSWPEQTMVSLSGPGEQVQRSFSRWLELGWFAYPVNTQPTQSVTRYLLCLLHDKSSGQDKFTDVHFVPKEWESDLHPAVLYLRSHPEMTAPLAAGPALVQAHTLLHNSNPYLVLTAAQLLLASGNLTSTDMDTLLASADQRIIAASLVLARFYHWDYVDGNTQWLTDRIAKVRSLDQLEAVAFGVFAGSPRTLTFYPNPTTDLPTLPPPAKLPRSYKSGLEAEIIPAIRQRLKELAPSGSPADTRWLTIDGICRSFES